MDKNFGGVIWTNHALQRLKDRGIKQGDAWVTWRRPEQSRYAKEKGTWIYYRTFPSTSSGQVQRIEVVAKKVEKPPAQRASGPAGEWIILSVWSRYVFPKKKPQSFLRFWLKKIFKGK